MLCLECGNCRRGEAIYYCTARNEFIVTETAVVRERPNSSWRKGDPSYENHRRQIRKDKIG